MDHETEFSKELKELINKHSMENGSNTPDFILATYLENCLALFAATMSARDGWYGFPSPASRIIQDNEKE